MFLAFLIFKFAYIINELAKIEVKKTQPLTIFKSDNIIHKKIFVVIAAKLKTGNVNF